MKGTRGRKLALLVGAGALLVVVISAGLLAEHIRFYWHFEPLGYDAEGYPQFRHRSLGIVLVRRPDRFSIRFSGAVTRGETYSRRISTRLAFSLRPFNKDTGWAVWVGHPEAEKDNFSLPVTPPFRGMNSREIEAWHFRNRDNSGPNAIGPLNVNAPQEKREFSFVLTPQDYVEARLCMQKMLWPQVPGEREAARARQGRLSAGSGHLKITAMKLGNLGVGLTPHIDHMSFEVDLRIRDQHLESMYFE